MAKLSSEGFRAVLLLARSPTGCTEVLMMITELGRKAAADN
jgi:hypothetical protein